MDIHPSVLSNGLTRQTIYNATEQAHITTHIGNAPTQIFMLGDDENGQLLAISAIVRHEDILVFHVAAAAPKYAALAESAPAEVPVDSPPGSPTYGTSADGLVITEELVRAVHADAVAGYDVERLSVRTRPGRPAPLTVGGAVRIGLDESFSATVAEAALRCGFDVEEFTKRALSNYLSESSRI